MIDGYAKIQIYDSGHYDADSADVSVLARNDRSKYK